MKAEELIGKLATRLKTYEGDEGFMVSPVKILAIAFYNRQGQGVVYEDVGGIYFLPGYDDNHWVEYDPEMDKHKWEILRDGDDIPCCGECKHAGQDATPCEWCCAIVDSDRNYFQQEGPVYPYITVPDDHEPSCNICKFKEKDRDKQPCSDCLSSNNHYYFQPADTETIIKEIIKEIDGAREDLAYITKIMGHMGLVLSESIVEKA